MKVTTDGCLFGAWVAEKAGSPETEVRSILDIGAGTCLLSLMLAQKDRLAIIDAIEIDKDTSEQASENVQASPWSTQINIIHADAGDFTFSKKYDMIISNPPFYEKELKGDDSKKNLAHHNEGLLLRGLLKIIKEQLAPDGKFFLLLPYKRNEEIKKLLLKNDMPVEQVVLVRQTPNHDYFRILLQGKLAIGERGETILSEITIKDKEEKCSPEFQQLLKDYYLHL